MSCQARTEQFLGDGFELFAALDQLHAAGLAAATGMDLGLDHPGVTAECLRRVHCFRDGYRRATRGDRNAVLREDRFRLVFVEIHILLCLLEEARIIA